MTFDLVGLPPGEDEVTAFTADDRPGAVERLVDRLLESPHYGERWGRHWLDVARYADTKGYVRLAEERRFHFAYAYRDYVIRAFNEDLPFDRFIVEQLAADLLPHDSGDGSLAALGFLTLGRRFTGNMHDVVDDRIDVTTRGLMGLTVTCARCHDHKYDPLPTADYYSLYGVFAGSEDPAVPPAIAPPAGGEAAEAERRELDARMRALDEYEPKQYEALVNEFRARSADYLVAALDGRLPPQQPLPTPPGAIRQWIVERWIDAIERAGAEDAVFGPWHAFAKLKGDDFAAQAAALVAGWSSSAADKSANGNHPAINARVRERFVERAPQSMVDVARGYGELLAEVHQRWQRLQASTLAAGGAPLERLANDDDEQLRRVLYGPRAAVAVTREEALWQYLYDAPINNEITQRRNAISEQLAKATHLEPRAHVLVELPASDDARIFARGNPTRPGRSVPRRFLEVLSPRGRRPFPPATARLELARAIASRDNPLTARVIVNRVWAHHFGAGLVRTTSNFGVRGEPPSHPQLLDYLAGRFIDEGWSLKKLHRAILLSSVYQQSSRDRADDRGRDRDPENRLLWKMNRRRLDFEALRDALIGGRRPARSHDGRAGRRRFRAGCQSPQRVCLRRPAKPAGDAAHLRFRQPRRPQRGPLYDDRAAAGAAAVERANGRRDGAGLRLAGRRGGDLRSGRAGRSNVPRGFWPQGQRARDRVGAGVRLRRSEFPARRARRVGLIGASPVVGQRVQLCRLTKEIGRNGWRGSRVRPGARCWCAAAWGWDRWPWRSWQWPKRRRRLSRPCGNCSGGGCRTFARGPSA